ILVWGRICKTKPNRTIMVLGATGAGKSTLINGMINYILGVRWDDSYRFKLVDEGQGKTQAESQTSEATVYKINYREEFQIPHSLTIIDTPGFGDTRGIERDKEITQQLQRLFTQKSGVSEIDIVCFVTQSALARLTPTQKYVFDSVLSIFGKDVAENIRILVTFADGQRPPVLEAINASGVPCPKTDDGLPAHFKFNNSALFAYNQSSDDEEGGFDEMFWNMGLRSMKRFFAALNQITTKSLTMTNEVLRERQQLEVSVENLQIQVRVGLAKLEEVKETAEKIKEHEAEITRNENFEFEVTVTHPDKEDISGSGNYITNCQQCHHTCHYPCGIPNDSDKSGCAAMGSDGNCRECPKKCIWSVHYNQKYRWVYKEVKEKRTVKELKEKYLKAKEAKSPIQALISKLKDEYKLVQNQVVELMKKSSRCLNRLKEIALKPNPLSTPEYIDMLIESEKSEHKLGWKKRVQALTHMREKAEMMAKVERGETLLQTSVTGTTDSKQDQTKTSTNAVKDQTKTDSNEKGQNSEHHTVQDSDKDHGTDQVQDHETDQDQNEDSHTDQDQKEDGDTDQDQNEDGETDQDQKEDSETDQDENEDDDTDQDQNEDDEADQDQKEDGDTDQDENEDDDTDQDETGMVRLTRTKRRTVMLTRIKTRTVRLTRTKRRTVILTRTKTRTVILTRTKRRTVILTRTQ
ncbi:uncharacterized protein LOC115437481, partial [Sphaeramia orbicularis]|uniref:uncharacterized protein LOC115437481 n=1 Tax=Sphaeramia orbicularis TaxID=375764 RepID=UPI00117EDDF4